jgi:anti-anti-sigma factor
MTTPVTLTIEDVQGTTDMILKIIKITGQLDESNVDEEAKKVYAVIEQNPSKLNLILDLEGLEYMNSKSIGYLTDWYGKVFENSGKVVIAKAKPNILDILEVVGLTQLIKNYPTTEEAKAGISQ